MKNKLISLAVLLFMLLSVSLVGCGKQNTDDTDSTSGNAEVKLLSVSSATKAPENVRYNEKGKARHAAATVGSSEKESVVVSAKDAPGDDLVSAEDSSVTVIYKSQTVIYLKINLSNPKNYYIMDFKFTTDNPDDKIQVRQGSGYSDINDENTYVRWDEAVDRKGNHEAVFEIVLPSPEISPSVIRISEMYYSDRTDGTNKTAVNMNNRDTYTVYKVDKTFDFVDRKNTLDKFTFSIDPSDAVTITDVLFDGEAITGEEVDGKTVYN